MKPVWIKPEQQYQYPTSWVIANYIDIIRIITLDHLCVASAYPKNIYLFHGLSVIILPGCRYYSLMWIEASIK